MRKVLKSVFPFHVFAFVRYLKVLLRFSIILYFVSLFLLFFFCFRFFFCGKDDVLLPNAVERNFQSFNLSSAVQYYC